MFFRLGRADGWQLRSHQSLCARGWTGGTAFGCRLEPPSFSPRRPHPPDWNRTPASEVSGLLRSQFSGNTRGDLGAREGEAFARRC